MYSIKGIYDGTSVKPIQPLPISENCEVLIVFSEPVNIDKPKAERQLGFAKGAEIPDSFFEPLSEEDLQLWGL